MKQLLRSLYRVKHVNENHNIKQQYRYLKLYSIAVDHTLHGNRAIVI